MATGGLTCLAHQPVSTMLLSMTHLMLTGYAHY